VIGCRSTETVEFLGSRVTGAEISTPGIGPATVGVSGFELLDSWQALDIATSPATIERTERFFMNRPCNGRRSRRHLLPVSAAGAQLSRVAMKQRMFFRTNSAASKTGGEGWGT